MIYEVEGVVAASDEVGEDCQQEESSVAEDVQQPEHLIVTTMLR